jgi:hypothetical protein
MVMRTRSVGLVSLLVCGSVVLGVACGSSSTKKVLSADAGAAGEAGASGEGPVAGHPGAGHAGGSSGGTAGSGGTLEQAGGAAGSVENAGAGGASDASGAGGAEPGSEAGAGGGSGASGAAGAAPVCVPSGTVAGLSFSQFDSVPSVCQGSRLTARFYGDALNDFVCCGVSDATPAYGLTIAAITDHDGGGTLNLELPADAPLGQQAIALTCPGGTQSANIDVLGVPVVTGTDSPVKGGSTLTISGHNLSHVDSVSLVDPELSRPCPITSRSETTIQCTPAYPGVYSIVLSQPNCDITPDPTLKVTVQPPA